MYCSNTELGCLWKGHVAELDQHLKECVYGYGNLSKWLIYSEQDKSSQSKELPTKHKLSALTLELFKDRETKGEIVYDFIEQSKDVEKENKEDGEWKEIEEYLQMFSKKSNNVNRKIATQGESINLINLT